MNLLSHRNSNIELYRIIVMFLIVCHHYVVNSGLMELMKEDSLSSPSIFYYLFGMWGKTGINCFVLITGYFMCTSNITLRKFVKLYLWVVFYGLVINSLFFIAGKLPFSWELIKVFFPFRNIHSDSFTNSFLVWWLFIPFLNILVNNMDRKMHLRLMMLMLIVFSVYPFVPKVLNIDMNPICWFSTLFIIASYIRKYPETIWKSNNTYVWGWISFMFIVLSMLSVLSILFLGHYLNKPLPQYYLVSDSNMPLAVVVSVSSFMFFKNLKIGYHSFINTIAASSFGVLLIHANSDTMRQWLWKDVVDCVDHYNNFMFPLYAIASCVIIYVVCTIIDCFRQKYIEPLYMHLFERKK